MTEIRGRKESFSDVRITFKNFEGKKDQYNKEGKREFSILLDDLERADELAVAGWNVHFPKANPALSPDEDTRVPHLPVEVKFGEYPPNINLVRNGRVIPLTEDTVETLDKSRIIVCDIVLSPYSWTSTQFGEGIKAYCDELWANVEDNGFASKYGV